MTTLKHLSHALTLERLGNFTRAAEAANISQSAFSRSILNLEQLLGVPLFDRGAAIITPTSYGDALLQRARHIVADAEEMEREIRLMRGLATGSLTVSMGIYPAEVSGNRALGEMAAKYPSLNYRAQVGNWEMVYDQVLSRSADLGFAVLHAAGTDERLTYERVSEHEMVLFCRRNHPLAGSGRLTRTDLDTFPLISIRVPKGLAEAVPGRTDAEHGSGHLVPAIEIDDFATAKAIVHASDGIGAAVPVQIQAELESGEFVLLQYERPWLRPVHGFIQLKGRAISPAAEMYMESVQEIEKTAHAANDRLLERYLA
jgi:DNA-binding transcriptional LysR family regulator